MIALFQAANRDADQFPDPETFIIDRTPNAPTNFGAGIHRCIGSHLARLETTVAFRKLFERFPDLTRARPPVRQRTFELRGFKELPVLSGRQA